MRIRNLLIAVLILAALPLAARAQLNADQYFRGGSFMLTFEVGGAAFTDFQRSQAVPLAGGAGLAGFERRVSARTAATLGGWASYWITDGFGVRAGVGYAPSAFRVWNEQSAQDFLDLQSGYEARSYAGLAVWMANGAAVFRFPTRFGRVSPYALLGGGIVRYDSQDDAELPPEARVQFAGGQWSGAAGLLGLGAAIPLQSRNMMLSFELTDHITRTPLDDRGRGEHFELGGVALQMNPDPDAGTDGVGLTNNLRLVVGITLLLAR